MPYYANDGSLNVSVVDGNTLVGLYAADGSVNVVEVDGTSFTGIQHACGAYYVVNDSGLIGRYHPCGALNVTVSPYVESTVKVTVVSGSLGGDGGWAQDWYWWA